MEYSHGGGASSLSVFLLTAAEVLSAIPVGAVGVCGAAPLVPLVPGEGGSNLGGIERDNKGFMSISGTLDTGG
jgi:hypothetical protein